MKYDIKLSKLDKLAMLTGFVLRPYIYGHFSITTQVAQWCTSWHDHLMPWVRALGIEPRAIMWLLVGGVAKVQAPPWEVHQELCFCLFFWCL